MPAASAHLGEGMPRMCLQARVIHLRLERSDGMPADLPPIAFKVIPSTRPVSASLWLEDKKLCPTPASAIGEVPTFELLEVAGQEVRQSRLLLLMQTCRQPSLADIDHDMICARACARALDTAAPSMMVTMLDSCLCTLALGLSVVIFK